MNTKPMKEIFELKKQGYIKGAWFWFWGILILSYGLINLVMVVIGSGAGNHKATLRQVQAVDSTLSAKIEVLGDSMKQNQAAIERLDSNTAKGRDEAVVKILEKLDKIEKQLPKEKPKNK